ncbi:MAG: mechanosensitive ion channel domain-containing protein [Rickettsiales bacterium]
MFDATQFLYFLERRATLLANDVAIWFKDPASYFQFPLIAASVALAWIGSRVLRRRFSLLREPEPIVRRFSRGWFVGRAGRLIFPLLAMICFALSEEVMTLSTSRYMLVQAAERVAVVWLLWVTLRAFVTNMLVRAVGVWILVPAALLQLFGLFGPAAAQLNQYGVTLGQVHITAYTVIKAIFIVSLVVWIGQIISRTAESRIRRNMAISRPTQELLIKLFDILLYLALGMTTLNLLGIDLTALAVFSGALGVGLGFGLQKIASNFISGIILLTEKSININNLIEMDDGVSGYVRKLGARASVVETFDGKEVMVPNEDFITSRVANLTHTTSRGRVDVPVQVAYGSDLRLVQRLMLGAAQNSPHASKEEELTPQCFLRAFGESSVNFLLTFWLDDVTQGRWRAQSDVMFEIWESFTAHNVQIPFPQRDVYIRSAPKEMAPPRTV